MAGCDVEHDGAGDADAGVGRVLGWVAGGAGLLAIAGYLSIAGLAVAGWGFALAAAVIAVSALAGAMVGFWVGFAVNWFDRLFEQDPRTITMTGCILCAGKNTGFPPFNDNDWTFNLGGTRLLRLLAPLVAGLDVLEIRTRSAPGGGPAFTVVDPDTGEPALHCEIGSRIGDYAAVGGAIGSVAGVVAGALIGAAICVAIGLATFGIGALLCLLIVAAMMLAGATLGGLLGDAIGAGIGWIADELSDFDERGEAINRGCIMNLTGRWVTDSSHQHNEIHDIESAQLIECNDCHLAGGIGSGARPLVAAVGTGRHPTGLDP